MKKVLFLALPVILVAGACSDEAGPRNNTTPGGDAGADADPISTGGAELKVAVPETGRIFVKLGPDPAVVTPADPQTVRIQVRPRRQVHDRCLRSRPQQRMLAVPRRRPRSWPGRRDRALLLGRQGLLARPREPSQHFHSADFRLLALLQRSNCILPDLTHQRQPDTR